MPPHRAVVDGFPRFENAVRAAAAGNLERAHAEIVCVESDTIQEWFIEHAQVAGNCRFKALGRPSRPPYELEVDRLPYPPPAMVKEVFAADGYRCRYCQRPVVHPDLLRLFQTVIGKAAFPMGPTNLATHGSVFAHRAVVDHIQPRKRGGRTTRENLATACYPCNFGKADYSLEDIAMDPPRPARRDDWDGLECLVPALKTQARRKAT